MQRPLGLGVWVGAERPRLPACSPRLGCLQEKFLHDRIKVGGKTGVLGDSVAITREASQLTITSKIPMSKRYLKYLTKKFLKGQRNETAATQRQQPAHLRSNADIRSSLSLCIQFVDISHHPPRMRCCSLAAASSTVAT